MSNPPGEFIAAERSLLPAIGKRNIAFLGDSRTFQSTSITSTEYSKLAQGFIGWLQFLTRQRFEFALTDNYGVSGDTTTQMLARCSGMLSATTAGTIIVFGGTNDRSGSFSYATTISNLAAIRDLCLAAGRRVIFVAELPKGDSTNTSARLTGSQLNIHIRVRQWLLDQRSLQGVYVADPWQYMANITSTTGDFASANETKDGIHPQPLGAYHIALALKPIIEALFPPVDLLPWSNTDTYSATDNPGGCLNANPMMGGTAGSFNATGGSGSVSDSWSENAGPTWTRVYSKVTGSDGKTWQQVVLGGTGTTGGVSLRQVITAGNLAVGDQVYAVADIDMDASAANVSQLALQVLDNNAITSGDFRRAVSTEAFPNVGALSGVMRTPVYTLTSTTLQLQFNMLVLVAAVAATVRIGRVALRKVV
jgi:lysophospholipase L1-like esterase